MKVIGAGFGRTGTLTLKVALEKLGLGPCYHMTEVMAHPAHVATWDAATRGERVDWAAFFTGWGATVDWPACSFYKEIFAAHPDARVILSVRDPERWYQSCRETIFKPVSMFPLRLVLPWLPRVGPATAMAKRLVWERTFDGRFEDKAHALAVFRAHLDAVKREVPPDRLLVFEASQGWAPLCAFLGVPVPAEPFPHVNDTATVKRGLFVLNLIAWLLVLSPLAAVLGGLLWWSGR